MMPGPARLLAIATLALATFACSSDAQQSSTESPKATLSTSTSVQQDPSLPGSAPSSVVTQPSTTLISTTLPPTVIDFELPWSECLLSGEGVLAADTAFWVANGELPYVAEYWPVNAVAGASITVTTLDATADLDGDGVDDTVQVFSVDTIDGLGEGMRVCGTSRALKPYYNGPSNGNYGVVPVRLPGGRDGIVNRPPAGEVSVEEAFLYGDSGDLLPPYARAPAGSNTPARSSMACFEEQAGDVVSSYVAIEGRTSGWPMGKVLSDVEVFAIDSLPAGDFDDDGKDDVVQSFVFVKSAGGTSFGVRVCGTSTQTADWVLTNVNKPIEFSISEESDTIIRAESAGGSGINVFDIVLIDGVLVDTNWQSYIPD